MTKPTHEEGLAQAAEDHRKFNEASERGDDDAAIAALEDTVALVEDGVITEEEAEQA